MYHSITIGDKNTWDDRHLIPASRPLFNPPTIKENMVDIPGGDGVLDLTASLAGRPTYNNRTGSWTFYVQNGFKDWTVLYSEIMTYLHGQEFKAVLEDDPAYYYEGRFSVNQWKSDKDYSQIVINYNVEPYKKEISNTGKEESCLTKQSFQSFSMRNQAFIQANSNQIGSPFSRRSSNGGSNGGRPSCRLLEKRAVRFCMRRPRSGRGFE